MGDAPVEAPTNEATPETTDVDNEPLTAVSDSTMPGFEAPEPVVSSEVPSDQLQVPLLDDEIVEEEPLLPPLPDLQAPVDAATTDAPVDEALTTSLPDPLAPAIINQHGSFTADPPTQVPAINSILNDPNEGRALDCRPI